jgi:cytoskeletal protein CcmA (bactofilin family)
MDNNNRGDIRINGSGSAGGGTYNSVVIKGAGRIGGDLKCEILNIGGTGTVEGNLEAADGKINGTGAIEGDAKVRKFRISGSAKIAGSISGEDFSVSGSGTIGKSAEVQTMKIEGSVKIGQDCTAEAFTADGAFEIGGLLNADVVSVRLLGFKSRAKEIGGEKISITVGPAHGMAVIKTLMTMGGILHPNLEAEVIEGDEIMLENTTAKVVRGSNVVIGAGCDIGTVEYKGSYVKNGDARVGSEIKI